MLAAEKQMIEKQSQPQHYFNSLVEGQDQNQFYQPMKQDLNKFLIFYNFNRRHSGLRKEIKVRTPYEALKYWYNN
jgi:hypothetical protein